MINAPPSEGVVHVAATASMAGVGSGAYWVLVVEPWVGVIGLIAALIGPRGVP